MLEIPAIDRDREGVTLDKIMVIYTANEKGQFPATYNAAFIPSSASINTEFYMGYTNFLMSGFNMTEIPDEVGRGMQSFDIVNGEFKRYDKYGLPNPNDEKLEIIMTEQELAEQVLAKKEVYKKIVTLKINKKFSIIYELYGAETDTWDIQLSEAKEYQLDNTATIPFITNLANIRGLLIQELVDKILVKAAEYAEFSSALLGEKQVMHDRIDAAISNDELISLYSEIEAI
jgi:hypothetical protein